MIAYELFLQISVLFIIMAFGYLIVRLRIVRPADSRVLSSLCIYLIYPGINLNAFQIDFTPEALDGFLIVLLITVLLHLLLIGLGLPMKRLLHMTEVERLSVIYPNAGSLVIPLVSMLFGGEYLIYASAFCLVQTFCIWTHAQSVMSGQPSFQWRKLVKNVNLLALMLGLVMFLLHTRLPLIPADVVSTLAAMTAPTTMIMIGMLIGGAQLRTLFLNRRIWLVVLLRLIGVPLLVIALLKPALHWIPLANAQILLTIILMAMTPSSAMLVTQLAQLHNKDVTYAGAINILSTLCCIVTMPLMVALFTL